VEGRFKSENASRARWECAGLGWARRFIRRLGLGGGCKVRVKSGSHHRPAVNAGFGDARRRRCGSAEGCGIRGNPEIHRWHSRKMRIRGNPRTHRRRSWRSGDSGQPGDSPKAQPKGCEIRGDSKIHRRCSRKMQEPGKPGASSQAKLEERGCGETRRLGQRGRRKGCEIRGNSKIHRRHSLKMQDAGQPGTSSNG